MQVSEDQIAGAIKSVLGTAGWQHIKAELEIHMQNDLQALASIKRAEGVSDDFLRGRIDRTRFVLTGFDNAVRVHEQKKVLEQLQSAEAPAVGSIYENTEPVNPAA